MWTACVAEPAHATSAESPGALGRQSNGSTADGPSSPGASGREARSPSNGSATAPATTTTTNSAGDPSATAHGQLNKLKRFLATVQQFADDIAPDIGDRVRTLVLALVVSMSMNERMNEWYLSTTYSAKQNTEQMHVDRKSWTKGYQAGFTRDSRNCYSAS